MSIFIYRKTLNETMYFIKMVNFKTALKNGILIIKNWGAFFYCVPLHLKSWGARAPASPSPPPW